MARRGERLIAETLEAFLRIALAIALETVALVIWNVGTRPPRVLFADIRRSISDARALSAGLVRLFSGIALVIVAGAVLLPALPDPLNEFAPLEIFTFVAALIVEVLVGAGLRDRLHRS